MLTSLPFAPGIPPMLAKPVGRVVPLPDSVPGGLLYEPKWDGFRIIIHRSTDRVVLQPRKADDLSYAFPEVVEQAFAQLPPGTVVDGELVSAHDGRLWFEELGMRLRPRPAPPAAPVRSAGSRCRSRGARCRCGPEA